MTVHEIHSPAVISRKIDVPRAQRRQKPARFWLWSPRELENRGRRVGREDERAYRDLQAAAAAADWR